MRFPPPAAPWVATLGSGHSRAAVLESLRAAIVSGTARPGSLIPLDAVAAHFAVSRIPVREALQTLVGEGLVDHEQRTGFRVAALTREELGELYLVRVSLESAALGAAVRHANGDDDAVASRALAALEQATAHGDIDGHHRWSRAFHRALVSPCRQHRLLGMFDSAWNITEPGRPMTHASPGATADLARDHQAMLDAFTRRDARALLAVTDEHYGRLQDVVAAIPA